MESGDMGLHNSSDEKQVFGLGSARSSRTGGLMASKQGERTLADYSLISRLLPARVNGILWGYLICFALFFSLTLDVITEEREG